MPQVLGEPVGCLGGGIGRPVLGDQPDAVQDAFLFPSYPLQDELGGMAFLIRQIRVLILAQRSRLRSLLEVPQLEFEEAAEILGPKPG
jgi:hypothetical protein